MQSAHTSHAGAGHGSPKSYIVGFVLSIILTVIPFWIVMHPSLSHTTVMAVIYSFAVVQILVHLICFLHMNSSSEQRWNVVAFAFTVMVVVILISGSVWIMYNTNANMMMPVGALTE
jgi:cytochrome o ubiquinol oxidase operon protein cyoD